MISFDLLSLLLWLTFWFVLGIICYFLLPLPSTIKNMKMHDKKDRKCQLKKKFLYISNFISIYHAVTSIFLNFWTLLDEGITFGGPITANQATAIHYSLAYFIFDTIQSEAMRNNDLAMTAHHIAVMLSCVIPFLTQSGGNELAVAAVLAEVSNPFNLLRNNLKEAGMENSKYFRWSSMNFAATFIVCRFMILPFYQIRLYHSSSPLVLKFFAGLVWFVSWHWLFIIFNLVVKELIANHKKGNELLAKIRDAMIFLRKNKIFQAIFYSFAFGVSLGAPLSQIMAKVL